MVGADIEIWYEGEPAGRISNAQNDMWYIEGAWTPAPGADRFSELLDRQDLEANFQTLQGIRVTWSDSDAEPVPGLVLGIVDGSLVFRMLPDGDDQVRASSAGGWFARLARRLTSR